MYYKDYIDTVLQEMINVNTTQWRDQLSTLIKSNLMKFRTFATGQINKNSRWLQQNRVIILNQNRYPVKETLHINNCPNYDDAITRLNKPVGGSLASLDLSRIQSQKESNGTTKNNGNKSNLWLKKLFVDTYDGSSSFDTYAKDYYHGETKKIDMRADDIQELLPKAFTFVSNYNATIKKFEVEARDIISYINKNPITGQNDTAPTQTDLQMIKSAQGNNQNATVGKASTNANSNLNADTDYNIFMNEYFNDIIIEANNQADIAATAPTIGNTDTAEQTSGSTKSQSSTTNKNNDNKMKIENGDSDDNDKNEENNESEIYDKKRIACNIIKDAYNAKITAAGMVYRDLLHILQSHVGTYKNQLNNKNINEK